MESNQLSTGTLVISNMFIRIGGVPGVGKSTLINNLVEVANKNNLPVERVKGGDYLLKLAGVSSYDELRKLPEDYRASLRPEMYRLTYEEDRRKPEIIKLRDAHFSLIDPETSKIVIFPILPEDAEQMVSMVLLTADPEVIMTRRTQQGDRIDRYFDLKTIKKEQAVEIEIASSQAKDLGKELVMVDNSPEWGASIYKEIVRRAFPEGRVRSFMKRALCVSIPFKERK